MYNSKSSSLKILQFMNPPPPIGGVTISVKNTYRALKNQGFKVFYKKNFSLLSRYDVGHIHSSNPFKRLFEIIFLQLFCKKVIFTVHGLWFDDNFLNRLCVSASNGVVFLNENLYKKWENTIGYKAVILPSLYQEGVDNSIVCNNALNEKLTLLLYSHSRTMKNGQEVYGIEFALRALSRKKSDYKILLVDLDSGYSDIVSSLQNIIDIEYYPHEVNFSELISRCDVYIRPTCMDGSSVAIQEALLQSKRVIASDVVDRGNFVETYHHLDEVDFLDKISMDDVKKPISYSLRSINEYIDFIVNV